MAGKIFITLISIIVFIVVLNETWKNDIDIFKSLRQFALSKIPLAKKLEMPRLEYKLELIPQNIAQGVEVYGIKWKDDYKEFRFFLRNTSNIIEVRDIRIRLELLDGIVKAEVNQHSGSENISFSQDNSPSGIYRNGKLIQVTKEYYNTLLINGSRVFPKGYFEVRLIVKVLSGTSDEKPGYVEVNYSYSNNEEIIKERFAHDIVRNDENKQLMHIDTLRDIKSQKERIHTFSMTFDEPLTLGVQREKEGIENTENPESPGNSEK